ncbi:MAG TPA: hypothetical protein VKD28_08585 [Gemmatimonadales bacterium]|nr:hypothetical protein [Gemmatimonadales bacterium]
MTGAESLLEPILSIHDSIRNDLVDACAQQASEQLAATVGDDGDTIYAVDRFGEDALVRGLAQLARREPLCLIAEGIPGGSMVLPRGTSESDCRWRLLVDPLDGTRGLMYQKRSAWVLTGVAPNRGAETRLSDIVLAVQTEIPLLKQHLSDQIWAIRGKGPQGRRYNRLTGAVEPLTVRPSRASTLNHGFATVVRFFPGTREPLAAIDDEIVRKLVEAAPKRAVSFEDQYASSGGQLYELMAGHDRFVADLRPLVGPEGEALCCHPYDLCTELIAREAGVVVTNPAGGTLDVPLDITTDVAWVGYANEALRRAIEPVLQAALRRRGLLK